MVETQLISRGVSDSRVLEAMRKVPRHLFVEEALQEQSYSDYPLPIGEKQTISQPYILQAGCFPLNATLLWLSVPIKSFRSWATGMSSSE